MLDKNGLAYDIFLYEKNSRNNDAQSASDVGEEPEELFPDGTEPTDENTEDQPLFSDEFFVGKFIEKVLSKDTIQKEYLLKICAGLMLCIGAYQLPSAETSSVTLNIDGCDFFFDTSINPFN